MEKDPSMSHADAVAKHGKATLSYWLLTMKRRILRKEEILMAKNFNGTQINILQQLSKRLERQSLTAETRL